MKRPSFLHGVIVAAVLGFFASAAVGTLTPFVGLGSVIRLVIPALGLAYLLYLFGRNEERTGRVTTLSLWAVLAALTWWMTPPLPLYLLVHVGAIWLVRSLYFYSGVTAGITGLRCQRIEHKRRGLGDKPHRQRIPRNLVLLPRPGAVRFNSSCDTQQTH